jgi:hypothetical protein
MIEQVIHFLDKEVFLHAAYLGSNLIGLVFVLVGPISLVSYILYVIKRNAKKMQ